MDLSRISNPSEKDRKRIEKYKSAFEKLKNENQDINYQKINNI